MRRLLQSLAAPNTWVAVFTLLAVAGICCLVLGGGTKYSLLREVGFWLLGPLLSAGLLLVVVVIPLLLARRALSEGSRAIPPRGGDASLESLVIGVPFTVHLRPDTQLWGMAAPLRGPDGPSGPVEPPSVVAQTSEGGVWALVLADGEDKLPLSADLAERYQGDAQFNRVRLWLRVMEETAGALLLVIDVLPGPSQQPMTMILGFAGGERRTFVVEAEAGLPRKLTSRPCEPLPRAALGLDGDPLAATQALSVSVQFR